MITPRKRRITEALKQHLRHGPKAALVDAVDALLEAALVKERTQWDALIRRDEQRIALLEARLEAIRVALADNDVHSAEQIVTAALAARAQVSLPSTGGHATRDLHAAPVSGSERADG